jgi:hypothetical protein
VARAAGMLGAQLRFTVHDFASHNRIYDMSRSASSADQPKPRAPSPRPVSGS